MTIDLQEPAIADAIQRAAKLVNKALQVHIGPSKDKEYQELLAEYRNEVAFRRYVEAIIRGLDLKLLDVTEKGLFIAPNGPSSKFSYRLSDFRSSMSESEKAALVLAHVSIAAVFYPTTESLDDDEHIPSPASLAQFRDALIAVATQLKSTAEDPAAKLKL